MNQWWLDYRRIYVSLGLNELKTWRDLEQLQYSPWNQKAEVSISLFENITDFIFFLQTLTTYIFPLCFSLHISNQNEKHAWLLTSNIVNLDTIPTVSPLTFMAVDAADLCYSLDDLPGGFHYIKALRYSPGVQFKNSNTVCPIKCAPSFLLLNQRWAITEPILAFCQLDTW